jgi:protein ImuB
MARIACLWVSRFPFAALLRVEPELRGIPVAITDGRTARSPVVALSPEAQDAGVQPGMTAAQARALCAALVVRPRSAEALDAAGNALADVAGSIGVRVELTEDGTVFLDCAGNAALCASETELAALLVARAEHQFTPPLGGAEHWASERKVNSHASHGLTACIGIGSSKLVAQIAAREGGGVRIVPPGSERAYLARLPIALLDPDAGLAAMLASWGLRQIGDLAALPAGAVTHRLGPAGARLVRRACGEDDEPLRCRPAPRSFIEATDLDYAIEQLTPLLFLLRRLADRLVSRLALHGFACGEIELRLALDGGGRDPRRLVIAAPTTESKVLLTLLRAHLERQPPARGVIGVAVAGIPARVRAMQLDLFRPNGPAPAALAATIARLAALCGPDRVGAPVWAESHRPDAIAVAPFSGRSAPPLQSALPIVARVALRAFRPPLPLEVFESAGRLDYVRGPVLGGRVVHLAGPWRLHGEWWAADSYAREYYDVELSDGGVYRIYRDARIRRWLADGVYD